MHTERRQRRIVIGCLATLMAFPAGVVIAQTQIKPGFNLFSVDQDQEIGRQSAQEAERQLPILEDRAVQAYVDAVGRRLAAVAPGAKYPYQFKVVNASDINAFALPGGFLYLNRGLIEAARNEGELAGVMSHEMAHVALRHGTNQTSKNYLGQTGLALLGGLAGKDNQSSVKALNAVGGFGMNALFLKFSRTDEEQADVVGAQIMARAGYDPKDMVNFFELLRSKQGRDPSKVERFFSSHPPPANRAARINREMTMLTIRPTPVVGGFQQARSKLLAMRPAPSMQQIAAGQGQAAVAPASSVGQRSIAAVNVGGPSAEFRVFEQRARLFQIAYPANWDVYEANTGYGVTLAPQGGFVDAGGLERDLVYGVIVNHYDPFNATSSDRFRGGDTAGRGNLAQATDDLLAQILRTNPNLKMVRNSERKDRIDGAPSLSMVLSGQSSVTRQEERVTVFTRELPDGHILYALFIAPALDYEGLNATFNRMISSLQAGDESTHSLSAVPDASGELSGSTGTSVPSGTVIAVAFQQTLSSANSQPGDSFTARVVDPVMVGGNVAIAAGSIVSGRVVKALPSKKIGGRAELNLEFTSLQLPSGVKGPISASFHSEGKSQTGKDAATIGGAALGGAILGRILGKDTRGAVVGAVLGGAIGTGVAASNVGEDVTIAEGTAVNIQLDSPFTRAN